MAALIRLTNLWFNGRLAAGVGSDLSCEAYRRTLYQPYEVHMRRNSAEVITCTTTQISRTVAALNSLLQLVTSAVVAFSLLAGLLIIDAPVALAAAALFGSAYALLGFLNEESDQHQKIAQAFSQQLKALQEGLGLMMCCSMAANPPILNTASGSPSAPTSGQKRFWGFSTLCTRGIGNGGHCPTRRADCDATRQRC